MRHTATGNSRKVKVIGVVLCAMLFAVRVSAEAQQPKKFPWIGYLSIASSSDFRSEAFRQGLRDLGYIEGQNIAVESRWADGRDDRVTDLAAELVRLKVDVIVSAGGTQTTAATKKATETIPIVFATVGDPVAAGLVASFARPGGNVTGLSNDAPELSGKRLELLKEIVPRLSRVSVFVTSTEPANAQGLKEIELAAGGLGIKLQLLDVLSRRDIGTAFRAAAKEQAGAVLWDVSGPIGNLDRKEIAELAVKSRLPVIFGRRELVEAGGLMSYGVSIDDLDRRAATYVDKILKGATPADLPIEQPTKFEFVINLKTAKQIGLTIPSHVLLRADRVIK